MWYPRNSTCFRFAIFFSSASLAGAFGGRALIAYFVTICTNATLFSVLARGLMTIDTPGIAHWRAIYLVEGILTMGVAILAFFRLKDNFEVAPFLSADQKDKLRAMLEHDRPNESTEFSLAEVKEALKSGYVWVRLSMPVCVNLSILISHLKINAFQAVGVGLPIFSFSIFLPSIVAGLGFSNATSQLMTVPVSSLPCIQ